MPNSAEKDLQRAKDFRKMAREAKNVDAKRSFDAAADRLEKRGAGKANKVGRKSKPRNTVPAARYTR